MAVFNAQNPAQAQAEMARIDAILLRYEVRVRRKLRREIIRLWRQFNTLNTAIVQFEQNIAEILIEAYRETAEAFSPYIDDQLQENGSSGVTEAVLTGLAVFYLSRSQQAAAAIVETELSNMQAYARVLAEDGLSQAEIATAIRERAPTYSLGRADLIAETEVRAAADAVTERALEESGLEFVSHGWITGGDNRVRADHAEAGRTQASIPIDENFTVGGETLRYPRDPRASAKQILRCRCVRNLYTE